jgi:hypothetical protein
LYLYSTKGGNLNLAVYVAALRSDLAIHSVPFGPTSEADPWRAKRTYWHTFQAVCCARRAPVAWSTPCRWSRQCDESAKGPGATIATNSRLHFVVTAHAFPLRNRGTDPDRIST